MPAPQATFQPLQAYYQGHSVVYNPLPNQHLDPVNWNAALGTPIQEATKQLQQSYLNPVYKQQAIYEMKRAMMGQSNLDYAKQQGPLYQAIYGSVGPQGYSQEPLAAHFSVASTRGDIPVRGKPADTPQNNGGGGQNDAQKQAAAQAEAERARKIALGQISPTSDVPPPNPTSSASQFGSKTQTGTPSNQQQTGTGTGNDVPPARDMGKPPQDIAKPEPKPSPDVTYAPYSGYWASNAPAAPIDPASLDARISNLESLLYNQNQPSYSQPTFTASQGGPVPQYLQEGGQVQPPPAADQTPPAQGPPVGAAPMAQALQQSPAFQAAQQGTGNTQAAMAAFQGSQAGNLHPVVPATAVKAALEGIHTGVGDVIYNVGNGPGGQPTYTVYTKNPGGKGHSSTTIPLTNIAKFFPNLVSSSNMGLAMQGAEQQGSFQMQPPQQQPQQPPVWSPFGNQQPFAGNPPPGAPNPVADAQNAAIRNAVAQQTSNPQNLSASTGQNAAVTKTDKSQNPSNIPPEMRPQDSTHDAAPFGPEMQDQLKRVEDAAKNSAANGWKDQPNGYDPGTKEAYSNEGITWFVDTDPNTSHVPYLVTGISPSQTWRHYATGEQGPFNRPDGALKEQILRLVPGVDPTNMDHNTLLNTLADYNWRSANGEWSKTNQDKVEALTYQVLHAQRALDAANALNKAGGPAAWNPLLALNNEIQQNRHMWGGYGHGEGEHILNAFNNFLNGGHNPLDPNLTMFVKEWNKMKDPAATSALQGPELGDLNSVQWNDSLIPTLQNYLHDQGARMNHYIAAALHNNEKVLPVYNENAKAFRTWGRIPDNGMNADDLDAALNPAHQGVRASPSPSPTPARAQQPAQANPSATPEATPIDVRGMSDSARANAIRGKPIGTRIIDDEGLKTLRVIPQ